MDSGGMSERDNRDMDLQHALKAKEQIVKDKDKILELEDKNKDLEKELLDLHQKTGADFIHIANLEKQVLELRAYVERLYKAVVSEDADRLYEVLQEPQEVSMADHKANVIDEFIADARSSSDMDWGTWERLKLLLITKRQSK